MGSAKLKEVDLFGLEEAFKEGMRIQWRGRFLP